MCICVFVSIMFEQILLEKHLEIHMRVISCAVLSVPTMNEEGLEEIGGIGEQWGDEEDGFGDGVDDLGEGGQE